MFYFLKRKLVNFLPSILFLILINNKTLINGQGSLTPVEYNVESSKGLSALLASKKASSSGSGEIVKAASLSLHEPSCEELRAMWQFSKRQSRASEITNEIPTYHDPFAYNIWDPAFYPTTTRSMGGGRRINSRYRDGTARPVYGRVVIKPSAGRFQEIPAALERPRPTYHDEYRPFESSLLGGNRKQPSPEAAQTRRRQQPKSRNGFGGYGAAAPSNIHVPQTIYGTSNPTPNSNLISPQRGSFQRLKQLVWTERARELEEQRKKESVAARAAILKDITNGQHYKTSMSSSSPSSSSSSSSTSSASSTRRPKQGGSNNNNNNGGSSKNKLLRNENKARFDNNKDDSMQLVANPSYWSTNDNVKRSSMSLVQQGNQQYNENPDDVSMKDYYGEMSAPTSLSGDEMIYFDDDGDDDNDEASNYDLNAYFNRINQDNINDFYYEINQLLSRKPIQK